MEEEEELLNEELEVESEIVKEGGGEDISAVQVEDDFVGGVGEEELEEELVEIEEEIEGKV